METIKKYLKNSNTGDVVISQTFKSDNIKNIPTFYYRDKQPIGENLKLVGYVEISERKFNILSK